MYAIKMISGQENSMIAALIQEQEEIYVVNDQEMRCCQRWGRS